jgi:hypothetical protein
VPCKCCCHNRSATEMKPVETLTVFGYVSPYSLVCMCQCLRELLSLSSSNNTLKFRGSGLFQDVDTY